MSQRSRIIETALEKLRKDDDITDFTIASSNGKEWKVHKLVLFMYSDILYRMSTSKDFVECQTGRLVLHEVQEEAIRALIDYMYITNVSFSWYFSDLEDMLPLYIELWNLAEMYNVQGLQQEVVDQYKEWALKRDHLDCMCAAAKEIQSQNDVPEEISKPIVEGWATALTVEREYSDWEFEQIEDVLDEYPTFAADVMKEIAKRRRIG